MKILFGWMLVVFGFILLMLVPIMGDGAYLLGAACLYCGYRMIKNNHVKTDPNNLSIRLNPIRLKPKPFPKKKESGGFFWWVIEIIAWVPWVDMIITAFIIMVMAGIVYGFFFGSESRTPMGIGY